MSEPAVLNQVVTDPRREYISASIEYRYFIGDRALPQSIDDAERDFGIDIYDRMFNDPIIGGHVDLLRIKTLETGLTIKPAYVCPNLATAPAEDIKRHEDADRVARYVRFVLSGLKNDAFSSLGDVLWDMLEAIYKGHRLAEITTEVAKTGEFAGYERIESIRAKPRENYAFIVDGYHRFRGIMAIVPGKGINIRQGLVFDITQLPNAISPDKLFILTLGSRGGDPRGRSWLRSAYAPWYEKLIARSDDLKNIAQHAGGKVSIEMPENPSSSDPNKTPEEEVLEHAVQWVNGGVMVVKYGTKITVHYPNGTSAPFETFIARRDREIVLAIIKGIRATMEAQHASKADSGTGENLLDSVVNFLRGKLCESLTRPLERIVARNLGEEAAELMPEIGMSSVAQPDIAIELPAWASVGYEIDDSQTAAVDTRFGLPQRAEGWQERKAAQRSAAPLPPQEQEQEEDESTVDENDRD